MKRKLVAIIQARMGSTRLPGKVLLPLCKKPVLWQIVQRLKRVSEIDQVVVATTLQDRDQSIVDFCRQEGIFYFRGSEDDTLDRYYQAALKEDAEDIIRVTADCPLVDPSLIRRLILLYRSEAYDHVGIATGAAVATHEASGFYPDGLDTELFSFKVLETAWQEARQPLEREHVTPFIWQRPERFKLGGLKGQQHYGHLRLTLDHPEDYELISWIYESLYPENPTFELPEVLDLLDKNPEKSRINQKWIGKEGYEVFKK